MSFSHPDFHFAASLKMIFMTEPACFLRLMASTDTDGSSTSQFYSSLKYLTDLRYFRHCINVYHHLRPKPSDVVWTVLYCCCVHQQSVWTVLYCCCVEVASTSAVRVYSRHGHLCLHLSSSPFARALAPHWGLKMCALELFCLMRFVSVE